MPAKTEVLRRIYKLPRYRSNYLRMCGLHRSNVMLRNKSSLNCTDICKKTTQSLCSASVAGGSRCVTVISKLFLREKANQRLYIY